MGALYDGAGAVYDGAGAGALYESYVDCGGEYGAPYVSRCGLDRVKGRVRLNTYQK